MRSIWKRFRESRSGNVALIFALAAVPMCFLVGAGIDYGTAADRQAQLNGIADAAALAAVTPTMMVQSTSLAQTAALATFNAQASVLPEISYNASNLSVTVSNTGPVRTVVVNYSANYNLFFPLLLGRSTMTLTGSSTATGGMAPNIDFYLLLDDSPSMAVAATQTDINTMVSLTANFPSAYQNCAFGCHEQNPTTQYPSRRSQEDLYTLAHANGVTLRIDLLRQAAQNLMTTAQSTATADNANYRMAIYTFDINFTAIQALTSNLSTAESSAANIGPLEVYNQSNLTATDSNDDTDTDIDNALNNANTVMPDPGSGTNNAGDTPQEVLFIVTDGVEDKAVSSSPTMNSAYGSVCCSGPLRLQATLNPVNGSGSEVYSPDWCATIKGRGIRIAILYTEYLPLPSNSWYNTYLSPIQSNIGTQLQSCASPGLYYEVTTGGDISGALAQLFQSAVQSAYLSR